MMMCEKIKVKAMLSSRFVSVLPLELTKECLRSPELAISSRRLDTWEHRTRLCDSGQSAVALSLARRPGLASA